MKKVINILKIISIYLHCIGIVINCCSPGTGEFALTVCYVSIVVGLVGGREGGRLLSCPVLMSVSHLVTDLKLSPAAADQHSRLAVQHCFHLPLCLCTPLMGTRHQINY